jgi:hypothetical protein
MDVKYNKCLFLKYTKRWIFGMQIYNLATLHMISDAKRGNTGFFGHVSCMYWQIYYI